MAHIVCKYDLPGCPIVGCYPSCYNYNEWCNQEAKFNCNSYTPSNKPHRSQVPIMKESGDIEYKEVVTYSKKCAYFCWRHHEFSKEIKHYSYSEEYGGGLSFKGTYIDLSFITYLEIDGKVIIA